ncbi:MAG: hypothetical protein ABIR91_00290 [Candidatus Saccharimonadales bacterium]
MNVNLDLPAVVGGTVGLVIAGFTMKLLGIAQVMLYVKFPWPLLVLIYSVEFSIAVAFVVWFNHIPNIWKLFDKYDKEHAEERNSAEFKRQAALFRRNRAEGNDE